VPVANETIDRGTVPIETLGLEVGRMRPAGDRPFIPREPEPAQAIEDPGDHVGRRSLGVGVFNPQDERAAMSSRVEPVEQRRARAAHVQVAGRRRSKANAWRHARIIANPVSRRSELKSRIRVLPRDP
jgi:hypothetical protein